MSDQLTEKLSKDQVLVRDRVQLDLEAVLRLPQGRRVLLMILEQCGVYRNAYTGERQATDFRLGEQNVGLWLISQIEIVGPTEYPTLLMERARQLTEETGIALVDEV
jgi:hypothetical protein